MPREADWGWKHGVMVGGDRQTIKCIYCGRVINGGITRLKHHIAGQQGNCAPCTVVPRAIREEVKAILLSTKKAKAAVDAARDERIRTAREDVTGLRDYEYEEQLRQVREDSLRTIHEDEQFRRRSIHVDRGFFDVGGSSGAGGSRPTGPSMRRSHTTRVRGDDDEEFVGRSSMGGASSSRPIGSSMHRSSTRLRDDDEGGFEPTYPSQIPRTTFPPMADPYAHRTEKSKQPTITSAFKKHLKEARHKVVRAVGKFFLHNRIPPNAASSPYLQTVLDMSIEHGPGLTASTPYEIGHMALDEEYAETKAWVATFLPFWQEYEITIMCDGWTSAKCPTS